MPLSFVPENGSGLSNATSFTTVETANSYFDRIPASYAVSTVWATLSTQEKEAVLVFASDIINTEFSFDGYKKKTTQRLPFPRYSLYDKEGDLVDSDSVPELVQFATAELAANLAISDKTADSATKGISELKVDVISLKFDKSDRADTVPDRVIKMLSQFGTINGSGSIASFIKRY